MKLETLTAIVLVVSIVTFGALVASGKVEAAAFTALASTIVNALLPSLVQRPPPPPPPMGGGFLLNGAA